MDLGIVQPSLGAITLEQKPMMTGKGNIVITFDTGNSDINGKKVQLHHAENGTWTCETTDDRKYATKSCSCYSIKYCVISCFSRKNVLN
ncbi:pilin [Acinetobacter seifertii]|uniref:pilin n=1 Tax=Acinetobacter seifertii TaxID=1530123 RepID=UPI0038627929